MRTRQFCLAALVGLCTLVGAPAHAQAPAAAPAPPAMVLTIQGFPDGGDIPVRFSQAAPGAAPGEGTSPAMTWTNVPAGTQTFVLNMLDMDVARNKTTDTQAHWIVWNLPGTVTGLPEGVPKGPQLANGAFSSAPRARSTAVLVHQPRARDTTTCLNCTRSTSSWTSFRRPTPSSLAPMSSKRCRDTCSVRPCTVASSVVRSKQIGRAHV